MVSTDLLKSTSLCPKPVRIASAGSRWGPVMLGSLGGSG
ncbi:unnamed protein product [Gulo gulo]|uniref:Uncharacterized protein n=1 Tax=Gulo gulo TaxID=48420 RepID=A0A9X9Q788_GULGU|nr:unnamed protein product [Gulo gulo]